MFEDLREAIRESSAWTGLGQVIVLVAWGYVLSSIWHFRKLPHANQVVFGSLAMVVLQILLIFDLGISQDILAFFVAMAQLVLAISVTKVFTSSPSFVEGRQHCLPYLKVLTSLASVGAVLIALKAWVIA